MIRNPDPRAFTYEADWHCPACAEARFGQSLYDREPPLDSEGYTPGAVYEWDETSPHGEACGDCGRTISEPYCPAGYEVFECPGDYDLPEGAESRDSTDAYPEGWYWWSCQPGCLPDGDPSGPFATEAEALADLLGGLEG